MKKLASEDRTVFVSSPLMSEMAQTAHNLIVIDHGKLIAQCTVKELIARQSEASVLVRCSDSNRLTECIETAGGQTGTSDDNALNVHGLSAHRIGQLADEHRIAIYELTPQEASLEEALMFLTHPTATAHDRSLASATAEGGPA